MKIVNQINLTPFAVIVFGILWSAISLGQQVSTESAPGIECQFTVHEDKTAALSFSQIQTDKSLVFGPIAKKNLGYSKSNFWTRMTCQNMGENDWRGIIEVDYSLLDTVDIFFPGDGDSPRFQAGDTVPFANRPVAYRHPSIPLEVSANNTASVYIKFASNGSVQIPTKIRTEREFQTFTNKEYLILGFYNGLVAVIALLILALAVNMKETFYYYQLCYIASFHLLQITINGLGFQYLWFNSSGFNNHAPSVMAAWSSGFAIMFSREYLKTRVHFPKLDHAIQSLIVICMALPVLGLFLSQQTINSFASPLGLVVSVILTAIGVASIPKGITSAGYFVAGWACMLAGIFVSSLKGLGLLPISFLTSYAMQLGGLLEMILLAIGFTWRLKEAEKQKKEMEQKVVYHAHENQQLEAIAKTAQLLAHDIRKPFSMIKIVAKLLEKARSPADIASILEKLGPQLTKAQTSVEFMLSDLLEVKAHPNLHREEVNISALINSSLEHFEDFYSEKNITINRNLAETKALSGDPIKLQRALTNILQNAYQATPKGGKIWVETVEHDTRSIIVIEIVIGNDSSFVPEELRQKIFDMNYSAGKSGGTGLGLAIAKKIVTEHGGRITCESDKSWGTEFHIFVPITSDIEKPAPNSELGA